MRPALPALLATALRVAAPTAEPAAPPDCRWQPAFADDFSSLAIAPHTLGPTVNHPRWTAHTPWNGDFGDAAFGDPSPDPGHDPGKAAGAGPFSSGAEGLRITASRDDTGHWHSGLIAAADASGRGTGVRYGYFEARMKLPPGPGTWPAFWLMPLLPAHDPAPAVEIDVMEYYGHATDRYQAALHVWYRGKDRERSRHSLHAIPVAEGSLVGRWHDYGLRVGPREIIWYLDRAEVWRQPTPPELTGPLYPLVDLALGSGYPVRDTPNPTVLALRNVRLYRDVPGGCSPTLPAPDPAPDPHREP
jgi:beta-glucanase (GH16 family)